MSLREFLEINKVFFETVAALLLSLMAVLVSVAQSCTAAHQTALLDRQTRVAEAQIVPQLKLRIELRYDEATRTYPDELLIIDNEGGFARHWNIDAAEFIRVVCRGKPVSNVKMRTVEIPVQGYYTVGFVSSVQKGQLYKLQGSGNNSKFADLNRQLASSSKCDFAFAELKRYVKASYEDVLGNRHVQYFLVAPIGSTSELSQKEGELAFKQWYAGPTIEYSTITSQLLLDRLGDGKRDDGA